ncbi:MAG: hypothetical protein AAGA48_20345 [Myxococcota bacterium]
MFDNIGTNPDETFTRRQAESVAYTLVLAGLFGAAIGAALMMTVPEVIADPEPDPYRVFVPPDEPIDELEPAAPPPPRLGTANGDDDVEPEPDDEPREPQPLTVFEPKITSSKSPSAKGQKNGVVNGSKVGKQGGTGTSPCEGSNCGTGPGRASTVKLRPKRMVEPLYPVAARRLGIPEQICDVQVAVGPDGKAQDVIVSNCPAEFHEGTRRAMFKSRWHSYEAPARTTAYYTFRITYRLHRAD